MDAVRRKGGLAITVALVLALSAAGCREAGDGRIAVPEPTAAELLPEPVGLPYAEAAPVRHASTEVRQGLTDQAYRMARAVQNTAPDYDFDFGGIRPRVWETGEGRTLYAEPWETGYRYYYYAPGAAYPYFVHDGRVGYGFDSTGALVTLIDADGDDLPADRLAKAAPLAGRYYLQGRDLRNAAIQARRVAVAPPRRAPEVRATRDLALAQREQLRAHREEVREQALAAGDHALPASDARPD